MVAEVCYHSYNVIITFNVLAEGLHGVFLGSSGVIWEIAFIVVTTAFIVVITAFIVVILRIFVRNAVYDLCQIGRAHV